MSQKNRIANLLTGASLAALTFLSARGTAQAAPCTPLTLNGSGTFTITTNPDCVNVVSPANYTTITNALGDTIKDGFSNVQAAPATTAAVAVWVGPGAFVGQFINNGAISATEAAFGPNANNTSTRHATASGLRIDGTVPLVTNNGMISASALAHSTSNNNFARATAHGIEYDSQGLNAGRAVVVNSTNATIQAFAKAISTTGGGAGSASVTAEAHAIDMFVTGNGGGSGTSGLAQVMNSGHILATAYGTAVAQDTNNATAHVEARGVDMVIEDAEVATAIVTNYSNISAAAFAKVTGSGLHNASASVTATGVRQKIEDSPNGFATVTNSLGAAIKAYASAYASSPSDDARPNAQAVGVKQTIDALTGGLPGNIGHAQVTNYGLIQATAYAHAIADDTGDADATATGVYQQVENVGFAIPSHLDSGIASISLYNSGTIEALARANVIGGTPEQVASTAWADASANGVKQTIDDSPNGSVSVINSGGHIYASAYAHGIATNIADADATAHGVYQSVNAWAGPGQPGLNATANVYNSGYIIAKAFATATATPGNGGTANADANGTGVRQRLDDAAYQTATVTNSLATDVIKGFASAYAVAPDDAEANANAVGVHQDAGDFSLATLTVNNYGGIAASAYASAISTDSGDAEANATAQGVRHHSTEFGTTLFTAVNNYSGGVIDARAFGTALAQNSAWNASADATATGVFSSAGGSEENNVTSAHFTVINSGHIYGSAYAHATSYRDDADADARGVGVQQFYSFGIFGGSVIGSVTNTEYAGIAGYAAARATGADRADASANAAGVAQSGQWAGSVDFTVNNSGYIGASAYALAVSNGNADNHDNAEADAGAAGVYQSGYQDGSFTAAVTNNEYGHIDARAFATAFAQGTNGGGAWHSDAWADAFAAGVSQFASEDGYVNLSVKNSGQIWAKASAYATSVENQADADATAIGVGQFAHFSGTVIGTVTNGGYIGASAYAVAVAEDDAEAEAYAAGVSQYANGVASANFTVSNSGAIGNVAYIGAHASSYAVTTQDEAEASATAVGAGQFGFFGANFQFSVTNDAYGSIDGVAHAHAIAAEGAWDAEAEAYAAGVSQYAITGGAAQFAVNNSGYINASAYALATSVSDDADADASAVGVFQGGFGLASFTATVTNYAGGHIDAYARASAYGSEEATPDATALGVFQQANGVNNANLTANNYGYIHASAYAFGAGSEAWVDANAVGVGQLFGAGDEFDLGVGEANSVVYNSGQIVANALAVANGPLNFDDADARAYAAGIDVEAETFGEPFGPPFNPNINNEGWIFANARAISNDDARATAVGIFAGADGAMGGTIANSGHIYASAYATGANSETAHAVGIWDPSSINKGQITNTGLVNAYAEVADSSNHNGADAWATGILISGIDTGKSLQPINNGGTFFQIDNQALTKITNDGGTIWAGYSFDGGANINRGNAINLAGTDLRTPFFLADETLDFTPAAPNPVEIDLKGTEKNGHIYGDIVLDEHDTVNVTDGKTFFEGVLYSPKTSFNTVRGFQGEADNALNIVNNGDLVLCQEGWENACDPNNIAWKDAGPGGMGWDPQSGIDGPSYVIVDNFHVGDTGTITYQLTPFSDPAYPTNLPGGGAGNYPQVFANNATLDEGSTFRAWFLPGLYGDMTVYQGVLVANNLSGTFSNVVDNSFLLNSVLNYNPVTPFYGPGLDEVDLEVTRTPFDQVGGTQNQKSVGGALEKGYQALIDIYGVGQVPPDAFAQLLATLLLVDNKTDYLNDIKQLSGAQYAQGLQSIVWSLRPFNEAITDRMDCFVQTAGVEPLKLGGSSDAPGCFTPGQVQAWGRIYGGWNNANGDQNAPSYRENQSAIWGGFDYGISRNLYAGVAGGWFDSNMGFGSFGGVGGGSFDYSGGQLAVYGGWDNCNWYDRAIVSFGWYNGTGHRQIAINASPVDPSGKFDANAVSFYNEAGYRFLVGANSQVTPFIGLSLGNGELNGFTESDPHNTGAALKINSSNGDSTATLLGVRWNGAWGNFRPQAGIAWEHEFQDTFQTISASFVDSPSNAKFNARGSDLGNDAALVDLGSSYLLGAHGELTVRYVGRWFSDYDGQSVMGRFTWKFGAVTPDMAPAPVEPLKVGSE